MESLLFVSRKLSLEQAPLFAALGASASGRMKEFTTQRLGDGDGTSKPWNRFFFWDEASWFHHGLKSGKHRKNDVLKINGPVEIVDLSMKHGDFPGFF